MSRLIKKTLIENFKLFMTIADLIFNDTSNKIKLKKVLLCKSRGQTCFFSEKSFLSNNLWHYVEYADIRFVWEDFLLKIQLYINLQILQAAAKYRDIPK